jgi:nitrate reductase cytochrome c-type subunit
VNTSDSNKRSLNYSSAIVRSHTPNGSFTPDSNVSARITNTSTKCETCHNNGLAATGDTGNSMVFNVSHYLISNVSEGDLPNSTLCSNCHLDSVGDTAAAYGGAQQVDQLTTGGGISMDINQSDNNQDCWQCHVGSTYYDPYGTNSGSPPDRSLHDSLESNSKTIIRELFNCYQSGCHVF